VETQHPGWRERARKENARPIAEIKEEKREIWVSRGGNNQLDGVDAKIRETAF